jgi:RNA polymerase sigma-70 factor (ECF subfamily)
VQDTFIQAFSPSARASYDGIKPFGPYLMTIARNQVISRLRSEQREQRRRTSLAAEGPPPGPGSPEEAAMRSEVADLVAEFRGTLSAELRSFFDARYREDQNLMQAARALGLSRMKARIRDKKLRKRFLEFLRRRGYLQGTSLPDGLLMVTLSMMVRL